MALRRGSYVFDGGGIEGAERRERVEVMARMGVDGADILVPISIGTTGQRIVV